MLHYCHYLIDFVEKKTLAKASVFSGGERGIRTLETLSRLHDFQSCALDQLGDFSMVEINFIY